MMARFAIEAFVIMSLALTLPACSADPPALSSPTAPTTSPSPSPPPPTPAPVAATFTISMPIRPEDAAHNAFGFYPFGVHIGDHAPDGHPGWDIEYAVGTSILAAAEGTVQSIVPSANGTGFGIQIQHAFNGRNYRTIYGVGTVAPGVTPGARVIEGQPLGIVDSFTRTIGRTTVTYATTHFQLDDFSRNEGLTNPNAVSPETFLNPQARATLDAIWRESTYNQELVEPFVTNPRNVSFPLTRTWTLQQGGLAARIDFTLASPLAGDYSYAIRDSTGAIVELGTAQLATVVKPLPTIDFFPAGSSASRLGVYSVVGGEMQIDYASAGQPRPATLSNASTYRTQ